ncbi:MAG TPA: hypothetical protein VI007_07280, partial [bacterium]
PPMNRGIFRVLSRYTLPEQLGKLNSGLTFARDRMSLISGSTRLVYVSKAFFPRIHFLVISSLPSAFAYSSPPH